MAVIITMAGEGKRAKKMFNTKLPKFEIKINNESFLNRTLSSLKALRSELFIFVINNNEYGKIVQQACQQNGYKNFKIITILGKTPGQATTAYYALEMIPKNDHIFIFNIDTQVENLMIPNNLENFDGWVLSTKVSGNRGSFVKGKDHLLTEIIEKRPISDLGTIGLYYFKTAGQFKEIYDKYNLLVLNENGETYIAPFYKFMIQRNYKVLVTTIDRKYVYFLDDPIDLERLRNDEKT